MKNAQNMNQNPFSTSENHSFDYPSMKFFSAAKDVLHFEIFPYANVYNEKLPIIYANIRV